MDAVGTALCNFAQAAFGTINFGETGSGFTAAITYGVLGIGILAAVLGIAGLIANSLGITSFFEISRFFGGQESRYGGSTADSIFQAVKENGLAYTLGGMVIAAFYRYLGPLVALAVKAVIIGVGSAFGGGSSCYL